MANNLSDLMVKLLSATRWMPSDAHVSHARTRTSLPVLSVLAADVAGEIYVLDRFKATDRIIGIDWNASVSPTGLSEVDIGLYQAGDWNTADQTVVDIDCYCDGHDAAAAEPASTAAKWNSLWGENIALATTPLLIKPCWEAAAVSAQPDRGTQYDLCMTSVADPTAAATLCFRITYLAGD